METFFRSLWLTLGWTILRFQYWSMSHLTSLDFGWAKSSATCASDLNSIFVPPRCLPPALPRKPRSLCDFRRRSGDHWPFSLRSIVLSMFFWTVFFRPDVQARALPLHDLKIRFEMEIRPATAFAQITHIQSLAQIAIRPNNARKHRWWYNTLQGVA